MYNANNYGYNPYGTYMPQRTMQPNMDYINPTQSNKIQVLNGKQVDSIEVVKATDIPMDGSISYFPLADGSSIITKQIQLDGTSKITVFKPFKEEKEEVKYITLEDMKKAIDDIDLSDIDDLKDELKDLRQELKELKKKKKDE